MADTTIAGLGTKGAPLDYKIPKSLEVLPRSIKATFDGSGAGSSFLPTLQIIADSGDVVGSYPVDTAVAAGASADVSWFPGVRKAGASASSGIVFNTATQAGHYLFVQSDDYGPVALSGDEGNGISFVANGSGHPGGTDGVVTNGSTLFTSAKGFFNGINVAGKTIRIAGVNYTVAAAPAPTAFTLRLTVNYAGPTASGVTWSFPSYNAGWGGIELAANNGLPIALVQQGTNNLAPAGGFVGVAIYSDNVVQITSNAGVIRMENDLTVNGSLISSPFAAAGAALTLGADYTNAFGYDILLVVFLDITANTSGVITLGVGSNTAAPVTIITGSTATGLVPVPIYIASTHKAKITVTGTITVAIVGQIAMGV